MTVHIIDGNWKVRRAYEVDATGFAMRSLFEETFHHPDPVIWVFDGKNAKQARRDIYPGYKAKRKPGSDEFYQTMNVFKDLLKLSPKMQIEIPGYEGDDLIANLVRSSPNTDLLIHATDGDYHVLCNEQVRMTNPALPKISNEDARLYKTLVGDPGDDIPGLKGFGAKAFAALTEAEKKQWTRFFEGHLTGVPDRESLGLTEGGYANFDGSIRLLKSFWQIVGFLDISPKMMNEYTTIGKPDYQKANEMLKGIMQ